jgi:hypothetical protein
LVVCDTLESGAADRSRVSRCSGTRRTFADEPADHDLLRRENDQQTRELAEKVARIRNVSEAISIQVNDSNRALDALDTDMSSVRGMLSGSMQR